MNHDDADALTDAVASRAAKLTLQALVIQLESVTTPLENWLTEHAGDLPSLPDVSDADMALMYLRHLRRHLTLYINP